MTRLKHQCALIVGLATVAMILGGAPAKADSIIGVFSNPVLSGYVANDPNVGDLTFFNNSATAGASLSIFNGGSSMKWGTNPPPQDPNTNFSELDFVGATIPADPTTP